jgi:hypothetical protein
MLTWTILRATRVTDQNQLILSCYDVQRTGHTDAVRLLLDAGSDVRARNAAGHTPLGEAALGGHTACCQLLTQWCGERKGREGKEREGKGKGSKQAYVRGRYQWRCTAWLVSSGQATGAKHVCCSDIASPELCPRHLAAISERFFTLPTSTGYCKNCPRHHVMQV